MQPIITFLGGCSQLQQRLLPQAAVAASWCAHAAFVEGTWEHVLQPPVVAAGVFRGTSPLPLLCSSLEGCALGRTAAPTERLCLEELCCWINSREQCLELGWRALAFVLISQRHFSVVKSIRVTCRLGRSIFHLASSLLVRGEQSGAELLRAQGDLTRVHSAGGQPPWKRWKLCRMGQGRHGFSYKRKNVTNCHNANMNY